MVDEKWVHAAEQLSELTSENLFRTPQVNAFLGQGKKSIILSAKGMGKTHLLREKRRKLSEEHALVIPTGTGSDVDRVRRLPHNLPAGFWSNIGEDEWAAIWEIAIACAILLNIKVDFSDSDADERIKDLLASNLLPARLSDFFSARLASRPVRSATPSYIINELLGMPQSDRKALLKQSGNLIVQFYRNYVPSAVYVFIDSVDQALSEADPGNRDLWVHGQTGLARAAYDMQVNNSHIKVFTSVRQEAWSAFKNENKESIESFCVSLTYNVGDLSRMADVLASYYHDKGDTLDTVMRTKEQGLVRNFGVMDGKGGVREPLFSYLHRHSLGTPRSLIHLINSVVYQCDASLAPDAYEKLLRHEVNSKAGYVAQTKIDSEMDAFLDCLGQDYLKQGFFSSIDRNILTRDDMTRINAKVVGLTPDQHPFCELYNVGLLGTIKTDIDGRSVQSFKSPNSFDWRLNKVLPDSRYYLLHPALQALLSQTSRLQKERGIVIGEGLPWRKEWSDRIDKSTLQIFISYSGTDRQLRETVSNAVQQYLANEGIRHRLWFYEDGILSGEDIEAAINRQVSSANAMIAVVTENYTESNWCMTEFRVMSTLQKQKGQRRRLLPFIFEGGNRAALGALYQSILMPDIDHADHASLSKIGEALKRFWQPSES